MYIFYLSDIKKKTCHLEYLNASQNNELFRYLFIVSWEPDWIY